MGLIAGYHVVALGRSTSTGQLASQRESSVIGSEGQGTFRGNISMNFLCKMEYVVCYCLSGFDVS